MNTAGRYTTVLTIAGSDGSGGAGIQADLKTIAAYNCYGLSVITAITAQNTRGVTAVQPVSPEFIIRQFETIVADISIDAVKIGMLGTVAAAEAVAEIVATLDSIPVVLDTVMRSTSGTALFEAADMTAMKRLFPAISLVTPNLPEAARLTERGVVPSERHEIEQMARELHEAGAASVLIKGGHSENGFCSDCLLHDNRFIWYTNRRIETDNTHGTGCTLSSAIASGLAIQKTLPDAVACAIDYTRKAIEKGAVRKLGDGKGPLQHFPGRFIF